ncbi:hypothetical protein N9Q18_00085 [bacterium]|nr:hypothetical protein [bacterium]
MSRLYGWRCGRQQLGAVVVVAAVSAGACTGSDTQSIPTSTTPEVDTTEAMVSDTSSTTSTTPRIEDGPLGEVCPATVSIQTASLPDPAVGPLHLLLGPDQVVDVTTQRVAAPLVRVNGTVEDVVLEIRSGGPAVDFRSPLVLLAEDPGLLLAQVSTALAARDAADIASVGVVTLTDRSHDALIVDPANYPGVETVEAVRDAGIKVRHVTDEPFIAYLTATGALAAEQLVAGFDGEPAAFVQSDGAIVQQGDLLVEPALVPSLPQWGRPVTGIAAASAGWAAYDDTLAVRPGDIEDRQTCLGRLVPLIQRAIAAYGDDPGPTNVKMAELRSRFAPLARLTPELMDAGVVNGREAGVFGTETDATLGDFEMDRLEAFLPELATALGVDAVTADDLVTNEFIDPMITSAG